MAGRVNFEVKRAHWGNANEVPNAKHDAQGRHRFEVGLKRKLDPASDEARIRVARGHLVDPGDTVEPLPGDEA